VLPQAAEALRLDMPSHHAQLATAVDRQARIAVTTRRVVTFSRALGKEAALREQTQLPGFEAAFTNYYTALWCWAEGLTPEEVYPLLNKAIFAPDGPVRVAELPRGEFEAKLACDRREYLLDRAIYVGLFSAGEGFNPAHTEFLATFAETGRRLGDTALFDIARQHRHGGTPKVGHEANRKLKFGLLAAWVAGGLWCLESRAHQIRALRQFWPALPRLSPEAIQKAQTRLGLHWAASGG